MEILLALSSFLLVAGGGGGHANLVVGAVAPSFATAMAYWQTQLPNSPVPQAILDLLTPIADDKTNANIKDIHMDNNDKISSSNEHKFSNGPRKLGPRFEGRLKMQKYGPHEEQQMEKLPSLHGFEDQNKVTFAYDPSVEDNKKKITLLYGQRAKEDMKTVSYRPHLEEDLKTVTYRPHLEEDLKTITYRPHLDEDLKTVTYRPHTEEDLKTVTYSPHIEDDLKTVTYRPHLEADLKTVTYRPYTEDDEKKTTLSYEPQFDENRKVTFSYMPQVEDDQKKAFVYGPQFDENQKVTFSYMPQVEDDQKKVFLYRPHVEDEKKITFSLGQLVEEDKKVTLSYGHHEKDDLKSVSISYGPNNKENEKKVTFSYEPQIEDEQKITFSYVPHANEKQKLPFFSNGLPHEAKKRSITKDKGVREGHDQHFHGNTGRDVADVFFLEDFLTVGSMITPTIPPTTSVPALLRRDVADSIPFSTDRFADVVARFAPASLAMAGDIRWALDACEHPRPLPGEKAGCATSLEALVEFPVAALGTRHVRAFSAAMPVEAASAGAARGRYNVTALRKISDSSEIVTCHDMTYPYAVFYCHTSNPTRAYVVRLEPEDGAAPAMEALAVCHLDTSLWSPKHPYFQAHRDVKPGGAPACHFLTKLSIIWVPAGEARAVQ